MNTKERNSLYRLSDNLSRFWHRFIINNSMNIESGMCNYVYSERILPLLSEYMGFIFEDICIQYMKRQNSAHQLPAVLDNIGRWWGNNPLEKKQEEIDLIALNSKSAIFGECKWKNKVSTDILIDLKRKSEMFRQFKQKYYYIFSKGGFSESLCKTAAQEKNVRLITLDEIYG